MQRQLKLTFPDEESDRWPDPPAWERLDAQARATALYRLALMIARMLMATEADHD